MGGSEERACVHYVAHEDPKDRVKVTYLRARICFLLTGNNGDDEETL